ncbi:MAG: hypothetical protein AAF960_03330 [Bacteroidota bacterium]
MLFLPKKSTVLFSFFALFVLLIACQRDAVEDLETVTEAETLEQRTYPGVDERLWPFFERFENEAAARGKDANLVAARITGVIEDLDGEHVAGQCTTFGNFRPSRVTMDAEFWNRANDLFREFVVFHELGHCFLNRGHREDAFANGRCVSLMRSGTMDCIDNYNIATRSRYIDELFEVQGID